MSKRDLSDLEEAATAVRTTTEREPAARAFVLSVVEGPERGATFSLDATQPSPLLIGQSPSCDIRLTDPHASRRHASLEVGDRHALLTDLGSTNGTFVDGVSIGVAHLRGDELVRIGGTAIRVERRDVKSAPKLPQQDRFGRMIGQSPEMRRLYPLFERLAASVVPIVIEGETGTGKEVLAEAIHETGPRAAGPFVVFDCTSVPSNLVESELFGHERGAFTGAVAARRGVFDQAQGGTLLIDEIGDLELALQPKLLRVIERSEIRRVGADRPVRVDVRILAATRRDLDRAVQDGHFRDDLYHRLAVGRVELPPLRRRRGDVTVLAHHFWNELGGSPAGPQRSLLDGWEQAPWPGNVRQLRNMVARRLALGTLGDPETMEDDDDVPIPTANAAPSADEFMSHVIGQKLPLPLARLRVVQEFERRYIESVLAEHGGNVVRAAKASGIARRYFQILRGGRRR